MNIRRYVDNSPDPEIEDVHAHLLSGVPKKGSRALQGRISKVWSFSLSSLEGKNEKYLEFREDIAEKSRIKEIIESADTIKDTALKHRKELQEWWNEVKTEIEGFHRDNDLWGFRNRAMQRLKERLLPLEFF